MADRTSDRYVREEHPYDNGYWMRIDGVPFNRKWRNETRSGWADADAELKAEAKEAPAHG